MIINYRIIILACFIFCFFLFKIEQSYPAIKKSPQIEHTPIKESYLGQNIFIEAKIKNLKEEAITVKLYYRDQASSTFQHIDMLEQMGTFIGIISSSDLKPSVLEYYILVFGNNNEVIVSHPDENYTILPHQIMIIENTGETQTQNPLINLDDLLDPEQNNNQTVGDEITTFSDTEIDTNIDHSQETEITLEDLFPQGSGVIISEEKSSDASTELANDPNLNEIQIDDPEIKMDDLISHPQLENEEIQKSILTSLILSPEHNSNIKKEDLVIAVSFLIEKGGINQNSIQMLLDGQDITPFVKITKFLVSYVPQEISDGKHDVFVIATDIFGNKIPPIEWSFWIGNKKAEQKNIVQKTKEKITPDSIIPRYEKALKKFSKNNYDEARAELENLSQQYPKHKLASNFVYWTGECNYSQNKIEYAIESFKKVLDYKQSHKFDDALIMLGLCYLKLEKYDLAKKIFNDLLQKYPHSEYAAKAKTYLKSYF